VKKRVMVIDDETDFLTMLKLNLESTGDYDVLTLPTANNIISHVHQFKPDVIILDLLMPGIKGLEACEMLNRDAMGEHIPIIIASALDKDEDRLKAYKSGVVDYITKPIEKKELIRRIEKATEFRQ